MDLRQAITSKQPRKCKAVLNQIDPNQLDEKGRAVYHQVKELTSRFKCKEATALLDTI